jgi:hypothetical protein
MTLWECWIARNNQCFSWEPWSRNQLEIQIWNGILDQAKTEWLRTTKLIRQHPDQRVLG